MPRPMSRRAKEILCEIAKEHKIPPDTLLFRLRFKRVILVKREFIARAVKENIPKMTLAALLGLHHTTILHHASPAMRERKRQARTRGKVR